MNNSFVLIILTTIILVIIVFFKLQTSLFRDNEKRTKKKNATIFFISFVAIFLLFGVTSCSNSSKTNPSAAANTKSATEKRKSQWTEVYTFKGNGVKKSPSFELKGGETRLKYKYKSNNGIGVGMFAAYVVEQGKDIMKQGGIPEVMTSAESEESESSIQKSAGRYYLNINATGNWTVIVEEFK
jgi:hypothetical protein